MDEIIHWPTEGIVDLGYCARLANSWRFNEGVLEYVPYRIGDESWSEYVDWRDDMEQGKHHESTYTAFYEFMSMRARELGFTEPAMTVADRVAKIREQMLAVSNCQSIEQVREAVK